MVGDAEEMDSVKLEKKGQEADDGTDKLDGSEDGKIVGDAVDSEMVGDDVGGTDSAKLEKKE